jgi:glycosyltransferase involved in cell wall biosynthesis
MVGACPYPAPQGSQVLLRETARCLAARGHDVRLVVYGHGAGPSPGDAPPVVRAPRIPGYTKTGAGLSPFKPLADALLARTLRRLLRDWAPDLVHAHNVEALAACLLAAGRGGPPVVYHAHTAMGEELPVMARPRGLARRFGRWLDATLPRRAAAVVAPHEALAAYLVRRGCAAGRVHVVPPPCDAEAFSLAARHDRVAPVLYAGNLDPYQNLPLLRAAMARLRARIPEARLVLATAAAVPRRDWPDAEVVATPGFEALRDVLARDAVFVSPRVSWYGYPMKVLNAMAAGLPVVACAGAAHAVTHGHDGLATPGDDPEALADALAGLMTDAAERERLGRNARETVRTRHAHAPIAAHLEAVYAGLGLSRSECR